MTDVQTRPIILGQGHVTRALADPAFFSQMPEFASFRVKMQAMHADLTVKRGCSGCKKTRVVRNLFSEFLTVARALSPDGLSRLKAYFGVDRLMLTTVAPNGRAQVQLM